MFKKISETIFGKKINNTRIVPLVIKILSVFILFILISNFSTNYINLMFNRSKLIKLQKQLLIKDLKDVYNFCSNQFEIYQFNNDLENSILNIEKKMQTNLQYNKSICIGVKRDGTLLFEASKFKKIGIFEDKDTLKILNENRLGNKTEEIIDFKFNNDKYFGIYKYSYKWDVYIITGEETQEFYMESLLIFRNISFIIIILTFLSAIIGTFIIRYILRFVHIITNSIMNMIQAQKMGLIDLSKAPNDEITFLGVSFNSLSSSINNLMNIFLKFVNKDIALKAYEDKFIKLDGSKKELSILFSDIKSFTYMTETLGIDIIKLLNVHYERAIKHILLHDGVVGSIIGDALLAVFGVMSGDKDGVNKSFQAVNSAYDIQDVTAELRSSMYVVRESLIKRNGKLTEQEEKLFKAVLIEVGVGIDGGDVFYGTIGSYDRMTNTVIGDNVNSASRLEGLTRVYKVPVICSDFVKDDIERNIINSGIIFIEIDTVQVKGKTIGKKIYYPAREKDFSEELIKNLDNFQRGLKLYYDGDWKNAYKEFLKCSLSLADVFKDRTLNYDPPKDWNGIWTMTTK